MGGIKTTFAGGWLSVTVGDHAVDVNIAGGGDLDRALDILLERLAGFKKGDLLLAAIQTMVGGERD